MCLYHMVMPSALLDFLGVFLGVNWFLDVNWFSLKSLLDAQSNTTVLLGAQKAAYMLKPFT